MITLDPSQPGFHEAFNKTARAQEDAAFNALFIAAPEDTTGLISYAMIAHLLDQERRIWILEQPGTDRKMAADLPEERLRYVRDRAKVEKAFGPYFTKAYASVRDPKIKQEKMMTKMGRPRPIMPEFYSDGSHS